MDEKKNLKQKFMMKVYTQMDETWYVYENDHKDVIGHMGEIIPMDELW